MGWQVGRRGGASHRPRHIHPKRDSRMTPLISRNPCTGAPLPSPCPVRAIGHFGKVFYFRDACRRVRRLTTRQMDRADEVAALFCGRTAWLDRAFAGHRTSTAKFHALRDCLLLGCRAAGIRQPPLLKAMVKAQRPNKWSTLSRERVVPPGVVQRFVTFNANHQIWSDRGNNVLYFTPRAGRHARFSRAEPSDDPRGAA